MIPQKFNLNNHFFWISIAIIGKVCLVLLLQQNLELWGKEMPFLFGGDAPMYIKVAENFQKFGVYALYGDNLNNLEPYSGRMPGYEPLIIFLNLFFSKLGTLYCLISLQIVLAAISSYYLAKTAFIVFNKEGLFYLTFFVYLINTYVAVFDISILTESFAISAFIISLYLLIKPKKVIIHYLMSGVLLGWGIFLRQYFAILFFIFILVIVFAEYKKSSDNFIKPSLIKVLTFCAFFIIADTLWIIRNYQVKEKFIPLVDDLYAGYKYPERQKALMTFIQSWGGDIIWWNPKAEIALFMKNSATDKLPKTYNSVDELPKYLFTSRFNLDSLRKLEKVYSSLENNNIFASEEQKLKESWVVKTCREYKVDFAKEEPFYFYFVAPLRLLPKFLFHSGTYNISSKSFSEQNILGKTFKVFYTLLYWLTLLGGFSSIVYLLVSRDLDLNKSLVIIVALYSILLCPLLLKRIEYRYFVLSYPYLTILMCYLLHRLNNGASKLVRLSLGEGV